MDLLTYISDMSRRVALADACGTSPEYLWQIATGWRGKRPSARLACAIERESARLGPEVVRKEPMIFGRPSPVSGQVIAAAVDLRMSKRALRARLGIASDKHLATLLQLPAEQVEAWPEDGALPALPQIQRLLGGESKPPDPIAPTDFDHNRIVPVDAA
ncbi:MULTISPECIES: hypothetical protein [Stenotrophomonas]|uniref:hypothetical protein n=1 Tax=Stenotrophomonas TaxID=40323 RepID=UPI00066C3080|nr:MULTISPECIES: hypothetical protein [Stenotrophomonas]MDQ7290079.1 hypothetical protein [Stenotrophomonas sp. Sm2128]HDS1830697.1 hypothetical protein [Stenotrophomonas maltophilia]HDX0931635.1 hypothetical protein [Stenotrophomonas maltophilia]HDX0934524.1 hypothetical protein [Stenotrophomonas maltophilia]HDX0944263.1 hypothetical protein [Stenotrophomonas maltophilia]